MHRTAGRIFGALGPALALSLVACSSADMPTERTGSNDSVDGSGEASQDGAPQQAPDSAAVGDAAPQGDATLPDGPSGEAAADAAPESASDACSIFGAPGECITTTACAALGDHSSYAGVCPGPASIECCIDTPDVSDDPPVPTGYTLMQQSQVTSAMTTWAVAILHDPTTYPMFSTTTQVFGAQTVLARVEWHPPDFQNNVVHRGVTLYVPG
jgi:hypothetical protein